MQWNFFNIFKKADFNTLMFSVAITGWIFYKYPELNYILVVTIFCSIYCFARLVVCLFNSFQDWRRTHTDRLYYKQQEEKKTLRTKLEAQYVYDMLSEDNKKLFYSIVKTAVKSGYSDVYILHGMDSCSPIVTQLRNYLYRDNLINSWVIIYESVDSVSVSIKAPLNEILESKCK